MANLVYPNVENTTITGDTIPEDNTTYTWESSVGNPLGDFTVNWSLSDELIPYFRILEQSYDV
jgi:precorrin-3B methylase